MMGFFDDLAAGVGLGGGNSQQQAGKDEQTKSFQNAYQAMNTLGKIGYTGAGTEATNALNQGTAAGEQIGRENAIGGTQAATEAARTQGINKGQAALLGGQQAGQLFTQGRQQGQMLGTGAYQTAQGQRIAGAMGQAQAAGVGGNIGAGQSTQGQQQATQLGGMITGAATAALASDENAKKDIKPSATLDESAQIPAKDFKYKEGDGKEMTGVMAQDVEKVNPENVVETPAGKAIDIARQTGTNTARISEAAQRIQRLEKMIGRKSNG